MGLGLATCLAEKLDWGTVSTFCLVVCSLITFGFNRSWQNEEGPTLLGLGLSACSADYFKSSNLSILQRVLYITIAGSTLLAHSISTQWHGKTTIVHADIQNYH